KVSLARGHDVRTHALVVFGGAGGQHSCAVARKLGMRRLLFPPPGGVLSAVGMGVAKRGAHAAAQAHTSRLDSATLPRPAERLAELEAECTRQLNGLDARLDRYIDVRYEITDLLLTLRFDGGSELRARFEATHRQRFGYSRP